MPDFMSEQRTAGRVAAAPEIPMEVLGSRRGEDRRTSEYRGLRSLLDKNIQESPFFDCAAYYCYTLCVMNPSSW